MTKLRGLNPTEMCFVSGNTIMVKTRYGFEFTEEAVSKDIHRLTNQI